MTFCVRAFPRLETPDEFYEVSPAGRSELHSHLFEG